MYLVKENSLNSNNPLFLNLKKFYDETDQMDNKIMIIPDAMQSKEIFEKGSSNKGLIKWCMENFMKNKHIFLDINAGFGEFTLNLSKDMKKTYAFESNAKKFACLVSNICLHGLNDKVIALPFKLSNETKNSSETLTYKLDDLSFLEENIGFIRTPGTKAVIEGAKNTLLKNNLPPVLFTIEETNIAAVASKKELFEFFESLSYKIVVINGVKDTFLAVKG